MDATAIAFTVGLVKLERWGCRAPRGGITIKGRHFKGGQFCWNAPADATPPATLPIGNNVVPVRSTIAGFVYIIRPLPIHPQVGTVAYAMDRADTGHSYQVHRDVHGEFCCDCPDFTLRRAGSGVACKHGRRLVELGLIEATTPRVLAPFAARPATLPPPADEPRTHRLRRPRFEPSAEDRRMAAQLFA